MKSNYFLILLVIITIFCSNNETTKKEMPLTSHKEILRQDLYYFIVSRSYLFKDNFEVLDNFLIEFVKTKSNETLFRISNCPSFFNIGKNNGYVGCINTKKFRLFIIDVNQIANSFYNNIYISNDTSINKLDNYFYDGIYGIIKENEILEIKPRNIDFKDQELFHFEIASRPIAP